jgi:hypothetical protein
MRMDKILRILYDGQKGRYSNLDKPDVLDLLIQQVVTAPNASTARWLLEYGTGK